MVKPVMRMALVLGSLCGSLVQAQEAPTVPAPPAVPATPATPSKKTKAIKIESHLGRPRLGHYAMLSAGLGIPGGELGRRFGNHGLLTAGYNLVLPSKWTFGLEGSFGFGRTVKQDPLSSLRDANGDIIARDGSLAVDAITEQLWTVPTIKLGHLFVLKERVRNKSWEHALMLQTGFTWMEYKYQIQSVSRDIAQLDGDLVKGYDRLTSGPGGLLEADYFMVAPTGRYSIFLRGQYMYCATQSRRSFDVNLGRATTGVMYASSLNFQIGLAVLFYKLDENDYFYY